MVGRLIGRGDVGHRQPAMTSCLRPICTTFPTLPRIASAWLIRRFIDPRARLRFTSAKGYAPEPGELRFGMAEAGFTHGG
jgi:hypothetical protein